MASCEGLIDTAVETVKAFENVLTCYNGSVQLPR